MGTHAGLLEEDLAMPGQTQVCPRRAVTEGVDFGLSLSKKPVSTSAALIQVSLHPY